jgi:hypothetical protein
MSLIPISVPLKLAKLVYVDPESTLLICAAHIEAIRAVLFGWDHAEGQADV